MNAVQIFGRNVNMVREDKRMSIKKLAEVSGYNRADLASLELGKHDVSLESAVNIAKALNRDFPFMLSKDFNVLGRLVGNKRILDYYIETDYLSIYIENLRKNIKKKNTTQEFIADSTGVFSANFSRIINKKIVPRIGTLEKFSDAIDMELSVLFERTGGEANV